MGKIQRDMEERGHSLESIMASIEARKPDFDAYIAPQKEFADIVIEVLPTQLDPEDKKTLRVKQIQKVGVNNFDAAYLFDDGSTIEWTPCGKEVQVLEMDGTFENIQELVYVESHLSNTNTQYYGELTQAMLALAEAPGSNNGTGFMQTLAAFAIRELYNKKAAADKLQESVKKSVAATAA